MSIRNVYVRTYCHGFWIGLLVGCTTMCIGNTPKVDNNRREFHETSFTVNTELRERNEIVTGIETQTEQHGQGPRLVEDSVIVDNLYKTVRILCWVTTSPENLKPRASHVKHTWGRHCNTLLFVSNAEDKIFPTINITVPEGHEELMIKTTKALEFIYENHINDADWFLKSDDDTMVIPDNLRLMLLPYNASEAIYFGQHFEIPGLGLNYYSGGAGYVLSKEALRRFAMRRSLIPPEESGRCVDHQGAEDAELGKCMAVLGVKMGDSRDNEKKSRFHCLPVKSIVLEEYPDWLYKYDKYGIQSGMSSMSDSAITFHYVRPDEMHLIDFLLYDLKVHGRFPLHTGNASNINDGPREPHVFKR